MEWPFKDYDFYGNRYIDLGGMQWYDRENIHDGKTPTECILCIEAEQEMYTKYAHPKAHAEATTQASIRAEGMAVKEKDTKDYIEYYVFHYGREYTKIYKVLYKKYKEEYSTIVLGRLYNHEDKICSYHQETLDYHSSK
jgi:hypothetical protein